jgi:PAS domain S-box-containing protein
MLPNGLPNIVAKDLSRSKPFIEGLMAAMQETVLVLDSRNCVFEANNAALKLFGYSSQENLKERHFGELFADPDQAKTSIELFASDHFEDRETSFVRCDGSTFEGRYSSFRVSDFESGSGSILILLRDITDAKVSEKKLADYNKRLEKNNQALDQFAYIVSHDLKAPLRAISNLSSWIMEDAGPSLSDESKSNLSMLHGRVARLEAMINGILEYSKVGRMQVAAESVDVYTLVEEVVELLAPPVHIHVEINAKMPVLTTQKIMLMQIFSNLISNAIKYNDKPIGIIRVYCVEHNDGYRFVVEDNGPGIPPEFFEKIFLIFQTLQSRDKFESTGIGLTIVKRIVDEVNGKIWVESEVGKGSKFIFEWADKSSNGNA